ncbi:unnamed protein product [Caenorhabditis bovis]|uniref:THAP-type domain-containing protein n=1 Tax=Caenorhabditis bovis TaxID=2654633 RepID=A0A8S1F8D6_9PELO|nr:unnamed protein product [Caenorhabditis bovis]
MENKCCYCGKLLPGGDYMDVPKKDTRLLERMEAEFGLLFTVRCNSQGNAKICRKHFDEQTASPVLDETIPWIDSSLADHVYFSTIPEEIYIKQEVDENQAFIGEKHPSDMPGTSFKAKLPDCFVEKENGFLECTVCSKLFRKKSMTVEMLIEHSRHKEFRRETREEEEDEEEDNDENEDDDEEEEEEDEEDADDEEYTNSTEPKLTDEEIHDLTTNLCRFFLRNGVPFSSVRDNNLVKATKFLNPSYPVPDTKKLMDIVRELNDQFTEYPIIRDENAPISLTVDFQPYDVYCFLAISVHYYVDDVPQCHLILKKYMNTESKLSILKRAIKDELPELAVGISNIVVTDQELDDEFREANLMKNGFECIFTILSGFADRLMKIPPIKESLEKLREFIGKFRENQKLWLLFRTFVMKKRGLLEFPTLDSDNWYTTIEFLTKCLDMHRVFFDFVVTHKVDGYITVSDHGVIVYLHSLLIRLKEFIKKISNSHSTVALLVTTLLDLKKCLENFINEKKSEVNDSEIYKLAYELFNEQLLPYIEGDSKESYNFVCFLNPHLMASAKFKSNTRGVWRSVADRLVARIVDVEFEGKTPTKIEREHKMREIDREITKYSSLIDKYQPVSSPTAFWRKYASNCKKLAKFAIELLSAPICVIDGENYFGNHGKYRRMLMELDFDASNDVLRHVCQSESFIGRGASEPQIQTISCRNQANTYSTFKAPPCFAREGGADGKTHTIIPKLRTNTEEPKDYFKALLKPIYEPSTESNSSIKTEPLDLVAEPEPICADIKMEPEDHEMEPVSARQLEHDPEPEASTSGVSSLRKSVVEKYMARDSLVDQRLQLPTKSAAHSKMPKHLKIESKPSAFYTPIRTQFQDVGFMPKIKKARPTQRLKCAYCGVCAFKRFMVHVPIDNETRELWILKLGETFKNNILNNSSSWICHSHFPKNQHRTRYSLPLSIKEMKSLYSEEEDNEANPLEVPNFFDELLNLPCTYCGSIRPARQLVEVPKDDVSRQAWIMRLGDAFRRNVANSADPRICRSHFAKNEMRSRNNVPVADFIHISGEPGKTGVQSNGLNAQLRV